MGIIIVNETYIRKAWPGTQRKRAAVESCPLYNRGTGSQKGHKARALIQSQHFPCLKPRPLCSTVPGDVAIKDWHVFRVCPGCQALLIVLGGGGLGDLSRLTYIRVIECWGGRAENQVPIPPS